MSTQSNRVDRVLELEVWAAQEGISLPIPAEEIVRLEDMGFVIDLRTGQILEDIDPDEPLEIIVHGVRHDPI